MIRHLMLALIIAGLVLPGTFYAPLTGTHWPPSAHAQGPLDGLTQYALSVYSEPGRLHPIIGVLIPQAKIIVEARDDDTHWVLGRSIDGKVRGWMERRFLTVTAGSDLARLPVSREVMYVPTRRYSPATYDTINLLDYPVVPQSLGQARTIFERRLAAGTPPPTISKIGDCISDNRHFLSPFGWGDYDLGGYTHLQDVVDYFSASLAYDSHAAYDGLVTSAVLDPLFANPLACEPGENPLRCEYRVHQPSVAVIMFGAQDLLFTPPEQFDANLRRIVHETIQADVIPILSTFPGNLEQWERDLYYNKIVVQVALDFDVPLMNFWRALESLPNHGLDPDGRHLSMPLTSSGDLTGNNLRRGYPLRNLITLQTLDAVWRGAMY